MGILKRILKFKSALKCGGYKEIKVSQLLYGDCLTGKNILITGGSSGIGFAIANKCVSCGANVVITGKNEKKLAEATNKIGPKCKFLVWDVTDISVIGEKISKVSEFLGGNSLDALINNAGVDPHDFFPDVSEKEWDRIYSTNSKGLFFLTQEICKLWSASKTDYFRKIINIDSQGGFVGATYPYRMSKWDIRGFTQGLGLRMINDGIIVNGIAPGIIKTDMQKKYQAQGENMFCDQNPICRVGLPEEVAELAVFMLSDACNLMVGQTILLDGGYSLK